VLTDKGRQTFAAAMRLQVPWVNKLSEELRIKDIETTQKLMLALRSKLERSGETEEQD